MEGKFLVLLTGLLLHGLLGHLSLDGLFGSGEDHAWIKIDTAYIELASLESLSKASHSKSFIFISSFTNITAAPYDFGGAVVGVEAFSAFVVIFWSVLSQDGAHLFVGCWPGG